jgi:hypothetical protein
VESSQVEERPETDRRKGGWKGREYTITAREMLSLIVFAALATATLAATPQPPQPNVLFVVVDDLAPAFQQ